MQEMNNEKHINNEGDESYAPKYALPSSGSSPVLVKGLYSIVLYLGLGYLLLRRWDLLLIIFSVVLLHELGHFIAMKYFQYSDVGIFFLPFLGAWVQGNKNEISQRQSIVVLLAGPIPGLLLGILIHLLSINNNIYVGSLPLEFVAQLLIWANLLNLLPLYPLDGGQLLNRIFFNEDDRLITLSLIASACITAYISISTKFYALLVIPALIVYRLMHTSNNTQLEKAIEQSGINVNTTYHHLSDKNYWEIRKILIKHIPSLHLVKAGPPYIYDANETKIARLVEAVLQKNLLLDVTPKEKIILALLWISLLAMPWICNIDFLFLEYLTK